MRTIAIINQKGGVGKTTTTINLAAALAEKGQRILVVDLDPQANASSVLGGKAETDAGLYAALVGGQPVGELLRASRFENLFILPAGLDLAGAEVEVARMDGHLFQLRQTLAPLREAGLFDFILLDCPPSLGLLMSNALVAADELLIPIQCEYYALEGLGLLMTVADQIRTAGANAELAISGMLMTMFDARTNLNSAVVRDVREHFQEVVFRTAIPRTVRFGEAPSHGQTILEYDPSGTGSLAYRALAAEFLERQKQGIRFLIPTSQPETNA
jgi:chromosome partitioning protein